jgi:peptidoglycan/xylan/chitin deacetylase (PgdA/CDA1 family)
MDMNSTKPLASLSLDLDNQWSYMKTHGDPCWRSFPSYLPKLVPYVLALLRERNLHITFFVVGQDAGVEQNREALSQLAREGHEVGNHSFHHEPWISRYTKDRMEAEMDAAEENIEGATGVRPRGFRGPGFAWSPNLLEILARRGYQYDASTLPTYWGPLARWYYFRSAQLNAEEKEQRRDLFGTFRDGFRPAKAFRWRLESGETLLEIPVSTIPFVKTPFHLSYLIYLCGISERWMVAYLQLAMALCKATSTEPSFLLHTLDFIDETMCPELNFFPGMKVRTERKKHIFSRVISILQRHYELVPMGAHAESLSARGKLKELSARREFRERSEVATTGVSGGLE